MDHAALLIVDIQEALIADNPYQKEELIENIKRLKDTAQEVGMPVFYVRHDGGPGDELEKNTPGWQIYHEIAPMNGEPVFDKQFNSSFKDTPLHQFLHIKGIRQLILVGMQTEYCIDATCKGAFERGYTLIMPKGTTSTFDNEFFSAEQLRTYFEEKMWKRRFASVISVDETIEMMRKEKEN